MNDKERIEFMIKSVTRTDSYLNYANTKSTILLTLASATLGTVAVNITKMLPSEVNQLSTSSAVAFYVFISFFTIFIMASIYQSIQAINPYLKKSEVENLFSFVDITGHNNTPLEYSKKIKEKSNYAMSNELASLNYNLAKGLLSKYSRQKRAINYFMSSLAFAMMSIITPNTITIMGDNGWGLLKNPVAATISTIMATCIVVTSFFTLGLILNYLIKVCAHGNN